MEDVALETADHGQVKQQGLHPRNRGKKARCESGSLPGSSVTGTDGETPSQKPGFPSASHQPHERSGSPSLQAVPHIRSTAGVMEQWLGPYCKGFVCTSFRRGWEPPDALEQRPTLFFLLATGLGPVSLHFLPSHDEQLVDLASPSSSALPTQGIPPVNYRVPGKGFPLLPGELTAPSQHPFTKSGNLNSK